MASFDKSYTASYMPICCCECSSICNMFSV